MHIVRVSVTCADTPTKVDKDELVEITVADTGTLTEVNKAVCDTACTVHIPVTYCLLGDV